MNIEKAIQLFTHITQQLEEIRTVRDEIKQDAFSRRLQMLIRQFFGDNSEYLRDLNNISWHGNYDMSENDMSQSWARGWNQSNNLLKTILEEIKILDTKPGRIQHQEGQKVALTKKIFVVHGHDEGMKQAVARTLERLGLEPVILHEQPNKGNTIIEKLTSNSDISFAVVLLSPDDIGYSKIDGKDKSKTRARQNVIFELGYFIGKIGREAVVALYPQDPKFEILTDYSGVVFIPFDNSESWKYGLVKELQTFGFDVDANKLLRPI